MIRRDFRYFVLDSVPWRNLGCSTIVKYPALHELLPNGVKANNGHCHRWIQYHYLGWNLKTRHKHRHPTKAAVPSQFRTNWTGGDNSMRLDLVDISIFIIGFQVFPLAQCVWSSTFDSWACRCFVGHISACLTPQGAQSSSWISSMPWCSYIARLCCRTYCCTHRATWVLNHRRGYPIVRLWLNLFWAVIG